MEGFDQPDLSTRVAYALTLADRHDYGRDRDGLMALARQIIDRARPLTQDPDKALIEAEDIASGDLWEAGPVDYQDLAKAISDEEIHPATMNCAVQLTDPSTPYMPPSMSPTQDLCLILASVLDALALIADIPPHEAARDLSDGRLAWPPKALGTTPLPEPAPLDPDGGFPPCPPGELPF